MELYVFYDSDDSGHEEYDIRGEAYKKLLQICCRNCAVLCLKFLYPEIADNDPLKAFEIPRPQNIAKIHNFHSCYCCAKFYRVCPELYQAMLGVADGIFEWLCGWGFKNPDDPTFYRSDGTTFFASEIHEGICAIMPREDDDLEDLLQVVPWLSGDDVVQRYGAAWLGYIMENDRLLLERQ